MEIIDIILLLLLFSLCVVSSRSDIKEGLIYNRILFPYACIGILIDCFYYGFMYKNLFTMFMGNLAIIAMVSLFLFFSHSFAGGDCKLIIVLAILYPANSYNVFDGNGFTLFWSIAIGIFWGYMYLLFVSAWKLLVKKRKISLNYVSNYFQSFIKSFFAGMIYISLLNLSVIFLSTIGFDINVWVLRVLAIGLVWVVSRYPLLKKWYLITAVAIIDIGFSVLLHVIPISIHIENYALVIILLLFQLIIRTNLYDEIAIEKLKKGMILSTSASLVMQNSRVKNLPGVSMESLKNRLTVAEAESVQRWAKYRKIETITIVKKIPFAIFISFGFFCYFILWSVL